MEEDELEKRAAIVDSLYGLYKGAFSELFNACMNGLPPETELAVVAFKVSKPELIVKACRDVLELYERGLEDALEEENQPSLFDILENNEEKQV